MIVQIRGTSGSGKSTVVRKIMEACSEKLKIKAHPPFQHPKFEKRRQPIGYILNGNQIGIPGHYETACGGCDTLPGQDIVFEQVRQSRGVCEHTIFEGLLASEEVRRTVELHEEFPGELVVIQLDTDVEVCLEGIRQRRLDRGDERPLKEDNTRNRVKVIDRACKRLRDAGVRVETLSRENALALTTELVELPF